MWCAYENPKTDIIIHDRWTRTRMAVTTTAGTYIHSLLVSTHPKHALLLIHVLLYVYTQQTNTWGAEGSSFFSSFHLAYMSCALSSSSFPTFDDSVKSNAIVVSSAQTTMKTMIQRVGHKRTTMDTRDT